MQDQWQDREPERQEQRKNTQTGGQPQSFGKRMWYLWGPIVIKWGIGTLVSIAAMMVYTTMYVISNYEKAMAAMSNQNDMFNLSMTVSEQVLKYLTPIQGVAALICIPVMLVLFHMDRKKEKAAGVVQAKKAPMWKYGAVVIIAAAMCIALNNLVVIGNLSVYSQEYAETSQAFYSASFIIQIICLGILIPISEELVFRGLVFKRLRGEMGFVAAGIYSSVMFGIMHGNIVQMIYGFVLGMMLAYVYEKYGSVKAPMVAHVVINLISLFVTEYKVYDWMGQDIMRIGIITVVCAALAATMYVYIQRIEQ